MKINKENNLFNRFFRVWKVIVIVGIVAFTLSFIIQRDYVGLRQFYFFAIGAVGCSVLDYWCMRKYGKYIAKVIWRE